MVLPCPVRTCLHTTVHAQSHLVSPRLARFPPGSGPRAALAGLFPASDGGHGTNKWELVESWCSSGGIPCEAVSSVKRGAGPCFQMRLSSPLLSRDVHVVARGGTLELGAEWGMALNACGRRMLGTLLAQVARVLACAAGELPRSSPQTRGRVESFGGN